jgi:DinB superfamily
MESIVFIDFSPIDNNEIKWVDFANRFTAGDLKAATNASIDTILDIIKDLNDAQVIYAPEDPLADDPHAVSGEEHISWSVAHVIVHTTASSEEGAAYSSLLARGIAYGREPRPRYETNWRTITTKAECIQRLEESRRIRLAFLDTWPDTPHLDVYREVSERFMEKFGPMNAASSLLFSLKHEFGHHDQIREAARQARESAAAV